MERIYKSIEVVDVKKNINRFKGKRFRSYHSIAKLLKLNESVTVSVMDRVGHPTDEKIYGMEYHAGFGEVEKTKDGWLEPKRLHQEY